MKYLLLFLLLTSSVFGCEEPIVDTAEWHQPTLKIDTIRKYVPYDRNPHEDTVCIINRWLISIDTTVIKDDGDKITPLRAWHVYNFDMTRSLPRCQKRNGYAFTQPLRMKVDTVKVDTVDWKYGLNSWISDADLKISNWWFKPVIEFTIDTTYILSPEQIKLLGGVE